MNYYTLDEAAKMLKVSPDTVLEWVRSGRLRASRLSGGNKTVRVSDTDITAFYEANATCEKRERKCI